MNDEHRPEAERELDWDALLPVAHELRRWVDRLPVWSEASGETWYAFSRRLGKQEQELAEKLGRMPGCRIARSPNGSTTTLTLAEVEAKAQGGLAAACRSWVAKVQRATLGGSGALP